LNLTIAASPLHFSHVTRNEAIYPSASIKHFVVPNPRNSFGGVSAFHSCPSCTAA
jgi:hypothetical protein